MFRTAFGVPLALAALMLTVPAAAQGYAFPINIRAQSMSSALHELARQTRSELLFDRNLVRGMQAPRVRSKMTVEAALRQLLEGTELTMRRSASGAWVIERRRAAPGPHHVNASAPLELPTPEILVIGKRSQNVDIQRRENDVQPYQVSTGEEIVRAHRDNLDQYFRSRVTGNTQVLPPSLLDNGETNSLIDLRGLGIADTMILVDGRRMPRVPDSRTGVGQPDINAIPLRAVERVETLTGTAGGIHGFGALGGVVNVVLKREYRGAELHGSAGITARGDARRLGFEGRFGFTPNGGSTDVMVGFGWSDETPLTVGDRDYTLKNRQRSYELAPAQMLGWHPNLNGVLAVGAFGVAPLVLKPEHGGAQLSRGYAFLPLGFNGSPASLSSALGNAAALDFTLSPAEASSQMGSSAETLSVIGNVRHNFGGNFEAFLDALYLRNRGRNLSHTSFATILMSPDVPQNPFTDYVEVTFPYVPAEADARATFESTRLTAGMIVPLAKGWRGTAEATFGNALYDRRSGAAHYYSGPAYLFGFPDEDPELAPFGSWNDFLRAASKYDSFSFGRTRGRNRYDEQSLRLAGPLLNAGGGAVILTLLAQRRGERTPRYLFALTNELPGSTGENVSARTIGEDSLYAELRAPLLGERAPLPLFHGLELQLAVRRDRQKFTFAAAPYDPDPSDIYRRKFTGTAYTAGAKFFPLPGVMLRGSYATGIQPPALDLLIPSEFTSNLFFVADPKRANAFFSEEGAYLERFGGSLDFGVLRASNLSVGAVLNPKATRGPRLSVDYSRVTKKGAPYVPGSFDLLANEEMWPHRVVRDPLTEEDRALGYSAGRIRVLDWSPLNASRIEVETLDGLITWTTPLFGGTLHAYGTATFQLANKLIEPLEPALERVGYLGSPISWRANGGIDFTIGFTTIGGNLQYFGRYRIYPHEFEDLAAADIQIQGSEWVRSQTYLDLYASQRFAFGELDASIDVGIVNVFDEAPPREVTTITLDAGYSMYGDPRRRRFEVVLSASF